MDLQSDVSGIERRKPERAIFYELTLGGETGALKVFLPLPRY